MKILWVTAKSESALGKSEIFGLSESLMKMGHEVTVVLWSESKEGRHGYLKYVRMKCNRLGIYKLKLMFMVPVWALWNKYDFIILDWQSAFIPAFLVLLSKLGLYKNNMVHDIRTIPVNDYDPRRERLFRICLNISINHYVGITTITSELKNKLCSEYDIPHDKVGVWNSGVDVSTFYPRNGWGKRKELGLDGKFIVFYHGSVGYRRGIVETVEAFILLKQKYEDIHFFILGSGIELENVRKVKKAKKLDNVHIHAPVEYREVPDYIAISDICIVPLADIECWRVSSPLKVMEYMAMGKPMVLTDIRAHREIIRDTDGAFFVSDTRPETLRIAIERAYSMRGGLEKLGQSSIQHAKEKWSWDVQAEKFVKYLKSVKRTV